MDCLGPIQKYVQVLMNEEYMEPPVKGLGAFGLSRKCYGWLLFRQPADPELGIMLLPTLFKLHLAMKRIFKFGR
jgi:hypothetical protein